MILTLTEMYTSRSGRYSILSFGDTRCWVMERAYEFNAPSTGVIKDEYTLERHSGTKYKNTFALVGDGVSHLKTPGIPRYACVIHAAVYPEDLKGCLSPCISVNAHGMTIDSTEVTRMLLVELDKEDQHKLIYQ
jgi:hypothetical protein